MTNYDSSTHTLTDGFFFALDGGTVGWRGADVITNTGGTLIVAGTGKMIDQNNGLNAFRNLAVNNGGFRVSDGYNFTTAGNFTLAGIGGMAVTTSNGATTVLTVSGSLTNFDATTHTLTNGYYDVEDTSNPSASRRFASRTPIFVRFQTPTSNWLVQARPSLISMVSTLCEIFPTSRAAT